MAAIFFRVRQALLLFFFLFGLLAINGQVEYYQLVPKARAPANVQGRSPLAADDVVASKGSAAIMGTSVHIAPHFGEDSMLSTPITIAMSTVPGGGDMNASSSLGSGTTTSVKSSVSTTTTSSSLHSTQASSNVILASPFTTMTAGDPVSQPGPPSSATVISASSSVNLTTSMVVPASTVPQTSSSLSSMTSIWSHPTAAGNSTAASNRNDAPTVPIAVGISVGTLIIVSAGMLVYFYIVKKRREQPVRAESPPPYDTSIGVGASILAPDTPFQSAHLPKNSLGSSTWEARIELVDRPTHPTTLVPGQNFPVPRQEFPATRLPQFTPTQDSNFAPAAGLPRTYPQPSRSPHPLSLAPGVFHPSAQHHEISRGQLDPLRSSPALDYLPPPQSYNTRGPLEPVDERHELA